MTAENPSTLIICNDNTSVNSKNIATNLKHYLNNQGMGEVVIWDSTQMSQLPDNAPQDLILVYSAPDKKNPRLDSAVDVALARVLARRMRSIVAVTDATSLPRAWASIPTYDQTNFPDVWNAIHQVKLPYTQAVAQRQRMSAPRAGQDQSRAPVWLTPVLIGCVVFLVFALFGVIAFKIHTVQQDAAIAAKPTAAALASKATSTQGAKTTSSANSQSTPVNDATLKDRQKQFDDISKNKPTIDGFRTNEQWDTTVQDNVSSCAYSNNTSYAVTMKQSGKYVPCIAAGPSFKNFALQITMDIKGDAGGVIFRDDTAKGTYYRLSVNLLYQQSTDSPGFPLFLCNNGECADNGVNTGNQLSPKDSSTKVGKGPLTLTIIARDKNIDLYVNGKYLQRFIETNGTGAGKVGLYAADLNHETTVTFSGLKIWLLDK